MRFFSRFLLALGCLISARAQTAATSAPAFTTTATGLQYAITAPGSGPKTKAGQILLVHYTGTLPDGTVFDSSQNRPAPFAFTLGRKQVIKGWDEGFALLQVGDRATFIIPPALAYGDRARGKIPPHSTLRFDVELVGLKEGALAEALAKVIDGEGLAAAQSQYAGWAKEAFSDLHPDENQLNQLGYRYLGEGRLPEATAVLQWNAELFPQSANVYDSLGEAEVRSGHGERATTLYARSLELDPKNRNAEAMLADLKSGPDGLTTVQERLRFADNLRAASGAAQKGGPVDIAALRQDFMAQAARNPASPALKGLANDYLAVVEGLSLTEAAKDWTAFKESPSKDLQEIGAGKSGLLAGVQGPLELKFTAADGRQVDLAQLRGKVVLVDFWATWCGPCVAEIPNLVATYEKYHAQGFEVVGISFDKAPEPGQPAGSAKTAEEVLAFAATHKMPWPQFYDGKHWKNEFGQRFGIRGIPAMFLIDREGKIVSTNARGKDLEPSVRRHLGL